MSFLDIERHYRAERDTYVKKLSRRAGSPEAAEDIVQEAYYRAMKYEKSFQNDKDFSSWFSKILTNCLKEHLNIERGYSPSEEEEEDQGYECPSYVRHLMKDVYALIHTKSEIQIEVLMLYFKHEYSAKNISEITSYTYSRCHQIIQRFREELRELYG